MPKFLDDLFNTKSSRFYDEDDETDETDNDVELETMDDEPDVTRKIDRNEPAQKKVASSRQNGTQRSRQTNRTERTAKNRDADEDLIFADASERNARTPGSFVFSDEPIAPVEPTDPAEDLNPFETAKRELNLKTKQTQNRRASATGSSDRINVGRYSSADPGVTSIYPTMEEHFEKEKTVQRARANDPRRTSHAQSNPNYTIKVFRALCFEDTKQLVRWLKDGYTVIVDFSSVNNSTAERMMDYIMGALDVTNGFWYKIVENVIIFLDRSKNVEESGRFAELVDWTNYLDHMVNIL